MAKTDLFVVLESFVANGVDLYQKGEVIHPDDPHLKATPSRFGPFAFPHPVGLTRPEIRTETAAPELGAEVSGLAKHRALVADAIALGLPGKGTNEELQAAIDAKLAEGGA